MTRMTLIAALALSACVATADDETALAPDFSKMDWQLVEVDGKALGWSATIHLGKAGSLDEVGQISGQAPCNRFFGPVTRKGDNFVVGNVGATMMACPDLKAESAFFALLAGVTHADQMPGMLTLSGNGHQMRFVQPID